MFSFGVKKQLPVFLAATFLVTLTVSGVWAHGGHKQETKIRISLPDVVAKVNGTEIKGDTIVQELKSAISNYKARRMPLTIDQEKTAAKKLIDNEISRVLILQKGMKIGVSVSAEMLDNKLDLIRLRFKSDAIFEHNLADKGITLEQYREGLKTDLVVAEVIQKEVKAKIQVSEQDIKEYYEKNVGRFQKPAQVRASVILIKVGPKAETDVKMKKRKKLESILDQIKNGADFASMAQRFSQDSLRTKSGDLGFFGEKQMFKPFSDRAFKMKVGEVSDIFKTRHGFHLLKVTEKKPGVTQPLEKARDGIEKMLKKKKVGQATRDYILALKKQADVKTYF